MRAIKTSWNHIRRSPYQAIAAILTMFITFLLGGIFFLTTTVSAVVLRYFESKPQITVFFNDKATPEDALKLKSTLDASGKTAEVLYVSQEDALKIYQEQNKNDPLLLEMVTADILPASLEVSASEPRFLVELEEIIRQGQNVEEVSYQRDIVKSLLEWTNAVRFIGLTLAVLLGVNALLVIMTIVNMKIASRKDEVEILNLVGASRWYIRSPFVLEGGLYGLFGAMLASLVIVGLGIWLRPILIGFLGIIPMMNTFLTSATSGIFLLSTIGFAFVLMFLGFLLGSLGSLVALARYLRF